MFKKGDYVYYRDDIPIYGWVSRIEGNMLYLEFDADKTDTKVWSGWTHKQIIDGPIERFSFIERLYDPEQHADNSDYYTAITGEHQ